MSSVEAFFFFLRWKGLFARILGILQWDFTFSGHGEGGHGHGDFKNLYLLHLTLHAKCS